MFNLFKNKKSESAVQIFTVGTPVKHHSIVQEIHDTFNSEVERILKAAGIIHSLEHGRNDLLAKADRLRKLGFSSTKEVKEADEITAELQRIEKANEKNQQIKEAIGYFSVKYPQYKFITEDSVKVICEKYGLIYGEISRYIGTVPEKNLQDMESAGIADEDKLYEGFYQSFRFGRFSGRLLGYDAYCAFQERRSLERQGLSLISFNDEFITPSSLFICAPEKDFDMKGMQITDKKLSPVTVEDPVVLAPVFYKGSQYFLVVTAWGDEANDELVVNQKMN